MMSTKEDEKLLTWMLSLAIVYALDLLLWLIFAYQIFRVSELAKAPQRYWQSGALHVLSGLAFLGTLMVPKLMVRNIANAMVGTIPAAAWAFHIHYAISAMANFRRREMMLVVDEEEKGEGEEEEGLLAARQMAECEGLVVKKQRVVNTMNKPEKKSGIWFYMQLTFSSVIFLMNLMAMLTLIFPDYVPPPPGASPPKHGHQEHEQGHGHENDDPEQPPNLQMPFWVRFFELLAATVWFGNLLMLMTYGTYTYRTLIPRLQTHRRILLFSILAACSMGIGTLIWIPVLRSAKGQEFQQVALSSAISQVFATSFLIGAAMGMRSIYKMKN